MSTRVFCRSLSIALRSISATFLLISAAFAAEPVTADPVDFEISEQLLNSALNEFARQSDREIFYASDVVDGIYANGVDGKYEPEEALDLLLTDTGLEYSLTPNATFLVKDERGDREQKNSPIVLTAQNVSQTPTNTEISGRSEGGTSIITGKVTDARTGANLKGAKVTIEETGQWTSTNDLGEFRFVNVPTGSTTLTVSYLGYAGKSAVVDVRGNAISQSFALRGGSEIEEIVVFGQRSARAQALNLERTADNISSVVSSEFIGQFPGTTIADVLRRLPGVSFQRDFEGSGQDIFVRGLEPDLNMLTLNGVELPEGVGVARTASLGNVLADSIGKVTVNKSLLPSHDSAGTGALVELETRAPLDFPELFISASLQGGGTRGSERDSSQASVLAASAFGAANQFGLSASLQYSESSSELVEYSNLITLGQFLPLDEAGQTTITSPSQIDPRIPFPFDSADRSAFATDVTQLMRGAERSTVAGSISGQWRVSDTSDIRLDIFHSEQETRTDSSIFSLSTSSAYSELPIVALGGEMRQGLNWAGNASASHSLISTGDIQNTTNSVSLRANTILGGWSMRGLVGYAKGEFEMPDRVQARFDALSSLGVDSALPSAIDSSEDRIISLFGRRTGERISLPRISSAAFSLINDPQNYGLSFVIPEPSFGENSSITSELSGAYGAPGVSWLKSFELGVFYEDSEFRSGTREEVFPYYFATGPSNLESFGLQLSKTDVPGLDSMNSLYNIDISSIRSFARGFRDFVDGGLIGVFESPAPSEVGERTVEEEVAPYLQASITIGDFDIIGGVRVSRVSLQASNTIQPTIFNADFSQDFDAIQRLSRLETLKSSSTEWLPRVAINYRPTSSLVVRGAYFRSVARPQIVQLSQALNFSLFRGESFGPNQDQPFLFLTLGNPDLKPSTTDNFEVAAEYYFSNLSSATIGLFYKDIENFIANNGFQGIESLESINLPDDPVFNNLPSNIFVSGVRPENDDSPARIWGVEATWEQQFSSAPGWLSGFGVYSNLTYADSAKEVRRQFNGEDVLFDDVSFFGQARFSGTAALTYSAYGLDGALSYFYQDRSLISTAGLERDVNYTKADDALDLRLEYRFDDLPFGDVRLFLEVTDLLNGRDEVELLTEIGADDAPRFVTGGSYLGGRSYSVGVTGVWQ